MAKVYPIIFSYFSKHPKKVEKDYRNFFFSVCKDLGIDTTVDEVWRNEFITPALLDLPGTVEPSQIDAHFSRYSEALSQTVFNKLAKYKVIESANEADQFGFTGDSPYILIYFHASIAVPPKSLINLFQLIRQLLSNTTQGISLDKKVVIILPTDLPSRTEFSYSENIQEECERNEVILIDKMGDSINEGINLEELFSTHKQELKEDPLKLLEAKLIGRVGHFQREIEVEGKPSKACHLYFYDGSKCIGEITDLLEQRIGKDIKHIIYHCPESPWLQSAITNLKLTNGLDINHYNVLSSQDMEVVASLPAKTPTIFVVDLLHTGITFDKMVEKATLANNSLELVFLTILYSGALNNKGEKKVDRKGRLVEFFLPVKQHTYQLGACEMCSKFQVPLHDAAVGEPHIRLQSYFYWRLTDLYGYHVNDEQDPPSYRKPLSLIPKFKEMLQDCGPYIASKYISYFDQNPDLNAAPSYTFICPNEVAASLIGRSLEYIAEISVIAVPPEVLKLIADKNFNKDEVIEEYKSEEWMKALLYFENESPNKSVVIFDEFALSGTKLKNLAILADQFRLEVAAYFPFVLYDENISKVPSAQTHSLYSFNLYLTKPQLS